MLDVATRCVDIVFHRFEAMLVVDDVDLAHTALNRFISAVSAERVMREFVGE